MYEGLRIAVIIPVYREAARVGGVVASLPAWVDHILVVDDASGDETAPVLKTLAETRLVVLQHERNQGVGGATVTGFTRAVQLGADVLVKMDGDGQMDPVRLPALLEPIVRGQADYTKGNRFLHPRELAQMPLRRRVGNIGLSFLAKMASGYWPMFDPNNGYVAIRASIFQMLDPSRLHPRFFFENSLLLELGLHRAVVRDVFMPARYGDKLSHLSERQTVLEFPPLLLRGFMRRVLVQYFVRDFTAVSVFLVAGLLACGFGTAWGAYHWVVAARAGVTASTGTVMIAVMPLILGIQILLQAVVLDIQQSPSIPIHPYEDQAK